jgi:hypothetical protein
MRLRPRRLLLAITIAFAAWWSLGWWLTPRPLYTLRFPIERPAHPNDFAAIPLDREGRLLLVRYPAGAGRPDHEYHWDIRDLTTGTRRALHTLPASDPPHGGERYAITYERRATLPDGASFFTDNDTHALWTWNLLDGKPRIHLQPQGWTQLDVTPDGAHVISKTYFPSLFMLSVVPPPNLPLALLTPLHSVATVRFDRLTLPDLRPVGQVTNVPRFDGFDFLFDNGAWLLFIPQNNPRPADIGALHLLDGTTQRISLGPLHSHSPHPAGDGVIRIIGNSSSSPDQPSYHYKLLVLAQGAWHVVDEPEETWGPVRRTPHGGIRFTTTAGATPHREGDWDNLLSLWEWSPGQGPRRIGRAHAGYAFNPAVPLLDKEYIVCGRHAAMPLPEVLMNLLDRFGLFQDWAHRPRNELAVLDLTTGHTLWRYPISEPMQLSLEIDSPGRHLITSYYDGQTFTVRVFSLPFRLWSRWLSRGAGLLVLILCLLIRRKVRISSRSPSV